MSRDEGTGDKGTGGEGAGRSPRAYDALVLTRDAVFEMVHFRDEDTLGCIKEALRARRIEVEHLHGDMDLWRDLEAVIERDPVLNFGAMWLVQQLRGSIGVPIIYGDVLIAGRDSDDLPCPLTESGVAMFRALSGDISRVFH